MSRALFVVSLLFIVAFSGTILFSSLTVRAQTSLVGGADPLTLEISPQNPAPYQTLTVTPSSSIFDINSASISMSVNGKAYYKGTGGQPIQIPLGGPGSSTKIVITSSSNGQTSSKTFTIHPASVALVVEPVSLTHPFYQGAGLVTSGAPLRIVSIPDLRSSPGTVLPPSSLTYTWKFGDQVLDQSSGVGKSVLVATAPPRYRDATVSVTVSSPSGSVVASAQTIVSAIDPVTRVYGDDPLKGPLFDVALPDTLSMTDAENTYRGVGYYYSEVPAYTWLVNGTASGSNPDLTVRLTGTGTGSAVLNFESNQSDNSLTANSTVAVTFGKASSGFLGL